MGYGDEDGNEMEEANGDLGPGGDDLDEITKTVSKIRNILPSILRLKQVFNFFFVLFGIRLLRRFY